MNYDILRWSPTVKGLLGRYTGMRQNQDGMYVLAAHAEQHENSALADQMRRMADACFASRQAAIRDCIAAAERVLRADGDYKPQFDGREGCTCMEYYCACNHSGINDVIDALESLLDDA